MTTMNFSLASYSNYLIEEELLCSAAVSVIQPRTNAWIKKLLFLLCILHDQLQLRQVEEPCSFQCVLQTLTVFLQINVASVEKLQAALERELGEFSGVHGDLCLVNTFAVNPVVRSIIPHNNIMKVQYYYNIQFCHVNTFTVNPWVIMFHEITLYKLKSAVDSNSSANFGIGNMHNYFGFSLGLWWSAVIGIHAVSTYTHFSSIETSPSTSPLLMLAAVTFFIRREFQPGHSARL